MRVDLADDAEVAVEELGDGLHRHVALEGPVPHANVLQRHLKLDAARTRTSNSTSTSTTTTTTTTTTVGATGGGGGGGVRLVRSQLARGGVLLQQRHRLDEHRHAGTRAGR